MTTLDAQIDKKQNMMEGKLTQAKGVVREQWGNITNDEMTRMAGKKDQIIGHLQTNYGNKWVVRHGRLVMFGMIATLVCAALAFIFIRSNTSRQQS